MEHSEQGRLVPNDVRREAGPDAAGYKSHARRSAIYSGRGGKRQVEFRQRNVLILLAL